MPGPSDPGMLKTDISLYYIATPKTFSRRVTQVSLGCHVDKYALPHVDPDDPETTLVGQNKRVCFVPPKAKRFILRKFKRFVLKYCQKNFTPLAPETDLTIESWLAETSYPLWRKNQLREAWERNDGKVCFKDFIVNGFVKDEVYEAFKHARGINARTDMFKCAVGPVFKKIEKEVFASPWFIKKTPVPERPRKIMERLYSPSARYIATDYTSYEGHFVAELMHACEFVLYKYMTQNLPFFNEFVDYLDQVIAGTNNVQFKYFGFKIKATRMTGEMNTSLGNGFSNLVLFLFCCQESGIDINTVLGFVEGDDGLFTMPDVDQLNEHLFKDLGLTIKLDRLNDLYTASFCGNVFHPDDMYIVTNPLEALASFGWTNNIYARSKKSKLLRLLRSKAMSMAYEYKACPILWRLAAYGLRVTEGHRAMPSARLNEYQRDQLKAQEAYIKEYGLPLTEPPLSTRQLVEDLYNIPISHQLELEKYLDGLLFIQPLSHHLHELHMKDDWAMYSEYYTKQVLGSQQTFDYDFVVSSSVVWSKEFVDHVQTHRKAFISPLENLRI